MRIDRMEQRSSCIIGVGVLNLAMRNLQECCREKSVFAATRGCVCAGAPEVLIDDVVNFTIRNGESFSQFLDPATCPLMFRRENRQSDKNQENSRQYGKKEPCNSHRNAGPARNLNEKPLHATAPEIGCLLPRFRLCEKRAFSGKRRGLRRDRSNRDT